MTDATAESQPAGFAGILAERLKAQMADRQRNLRRAAAAVAVVLVHLLAISVFVYSNQVPVIQRLRETIPEAIMWIPLPRHTPPKREQPPPAPDVSVPMLTAPITLPRIRNPPIEREEEGGLLGIGRSLACGASSYENLSDAQREHCLRRPWAFMKKPDGTIVLAPLPKVEDQPSIADIMRHQQQTAPPCPLLSNVPCLGKVMRGDPLGGNPSPF